MSVFKLCGVKSDTLKLLDQKPVEQKKQPQQEPKKQAAPPPRRFSLWGKSSTASSTDDTSSVKSGSSAAPAEEEDKHGLSKEFDQAVSEIPPAQIQKALWNMVKADNPDALLLRFLRARKWVVKNALVMLIATVRWRLNGVKVDDDIMKNGEAHALQQSKVAGDKDCADFMEQLRIGKGFVHGIDRYDRPLAYIRVRLHKPFGQSSLALERFIVYTIESARLMLKPPVETAVCFQ